MRILDNAEDVAERIFDGGDFNSTANVLHCFVNGCAKFQDSVAGSLGILDAPVSYRPVGFIIGGAPTRL